MGLFNKQTYVGLDLGHESIKAVQIERVANEWKVSKMAQMRTPTESIQDGVITDVRSVSTAIKKLLKEAHINATSAYIAVAGGTVVVRNVRIPKMSEATLRKSIKFEASRYVPSNVEDSFIDFEILGESEDGQMDVLMVAAPKDLVDSRLKACEGAGLHVESVDIEAFSSFRSLVEADQSNDWSDKTITLVDIGAATTTVSVIKHGQFAMTRTIQNGGHHFTEALKSYFKLSDEDADAGKAQLDLNELMQEAPHENPPLRVIQPHLDDLIREIRRSLNYYQSQQTEGESGKQIDQILVTGGASKMVGLDTYMEHKLALKTKTLGLFDNPRFTSTTELTDNGSDWTVASGLAMRAFAKAA